MNKNQMNNKLWILDTDIGWDPDDILALLIMVNYIKKNNSDKLAIITSNETNNYNRAKIAKNIVDNIFPNNNILVCYGIVNNNKSNYISSSLLHYYNENIQDINYLIKYMKEMNNYTINWIGIGSMTNLAYILNINEIKINEIIQMGGQIGNIEFNISIDPISCKYILENNKKYNTLKFITINTTGYNTLWLNEFDNNTFYDRINIELKNNTIPILFNKLEKQYPNIIKILNENTNGYFGQSALHDPITVIYALTKEILNFDEAYIECSFDGYWRCNLKEVTINKINNDINKIESIDYFSQIIKNNWNNIKKNIIINESKSNCLISFHPLNNIQKNNFKNLLNDFLYL